MKRIGLTESRPENENFKAMLDDLSTLKTELKEVHKTALGVFASGKEFHEELEKFCGLAIRSEHVFFKETEFLNSLGDKVCSTLSKIIEKDFNTLTDLIAKYKTAKLQFDAAHFQTSKKMKKLGGGPAADDTNEDNIMQSNSNLTVLYQEYTAAKDIVCAQRDVIVANLQKKVGRQLLELRNVSGAQHHQLCCIYFAQKLIHIAQICNDKASTESSPLLTASFGHNSDILADRMKSYDESSEVSTLMSGTFSQLIGSKTKGNVMKNRPIINAAGNGLRVEDKEERRESVNSTAPEVSPKTPHDNKTEDPEANRATTPYQVVDTQNTSGEIVG